jgi:serine protease Do
MRLFCSARGSWFWLSLTALALVLSAGLLRAEDESLRLTTPQRGTYPDFTELIKKVQPVVVNIAVERQSVQNSSTSAQPLFRLPARNLENPGLRDRVPTDGLGSGFLLDSAGHIVTNAHVAEGASKILITLSTGKVLSARLVAVHPKVDLALIKITPPFALQKARIGDSSKLQVGEWVLAVGNPYGLGSSVSEGIVSGKERFLGLGPDDNFIQTSAAINPGNSGGPLFNMAGEVIGINTAIIASGKGIGFAIPSDYVTELLRLPRNSDASSVRGWLGVYVQDVSEQQAKQLGIGQARGTFVDEVLASAPASNAGLRKGDLILETDGKAILNGRHLSQIVAEARPGDVLKVRILRGKTAQTVDVVIGKSPE